MSSTPSDISKLLDPIYQMYGKENVYTEQDSRGTVFQVYDPEGSEDGFLYGIATDRAAKFKRHIFDLFNDERREDFPFFAVVYPSFSVVFQPITIKGPTYLKTIPRLPQDKNDTDGESKIGCAEEAEFLFDISTLGFEFNQGDVQSRLVNLFRKIEAERRDFELPINEELPSVLRELDDDILQDMSYLKLRDVAPDANETIAFLSAFAGYTLLGTSMDVRQQLANHIIERGDEMGAYATPPSLADLLVDLADVQEDERVVDPACGVGEIIRSASHRAGEIVGIEKHSSIATRATAINHLLEVDAEIKAADALTALYENQVREHSFDHVITIPPFGHRLEDRYEHSEGFFAASIEEAISLASFDYLVDGGKFTALLPTGVLYRRTARDLRRFLFEEKTVIRIIEVGSGLLAPHSSIPVIILQVRNESPDRPYPIETAVVESELNTSEEIRRILHDRPRTISSSEFEDSYVPSEILKSNEAVSDLSNTFDSLITFDSIAWVTSGEKVDGSQLTVDEGIPFLKIGDVIQEKNTKLKNVPYPEAADKKSTSEGDILISTHGTVGKVVIPSESVVPSSNWAIASFDHPDIALVYASFLSIPAGAEQIQAKAVGSVIDYIPLSKLRSVLLPELTDSQIADCADELQDLDIDWDQPVAEQQIPVIEDIFERIGGEQ